MWGCQDLKCKNIKVLEISYPNITNGPEENESIFLNEVRKDVYIDQNKKSVFIGDLYEYTQFQFEDLETAYKVFDYLAILFQQTI